MISEQNLVENLGESVLTRPRKHANLVQILREAGYFCLGSTLGHVLGMLLDEERAQEAAEAAQQAERCEVPLHHETLIQLKLDLPLGPLLVPPVLHSLHAFDSFHNAVRREKAQLLDVSVVCETPSGADEAAEAVGYEDDVREL